VQKFVSRLMDGMYPQVVAQHTKTKMAEMFRQGYVCGGKEPLGYRKEDVFSTGQVFVGRGKESPKRLVVSEEEAEIVRQAFALYMRTSKIAAVRDYLTSVTGAHRTTTQTKAFLQHELYRGVCTFGEWRREAPELRIVDEETWEAVQDSLAARAGGVSRAPITDEFAYHLRGRVFCPHCDCVYTNASAKSGKAFYYQCLSDQKRTTRCPVARVNAEALHAAVLGEIRRAAEHRTVMHRLIATSGGWQAADEDLRVRRNQIARQKQATEMRATNFVKLLGDGTASEKLLAALLKAEAEIKQAGEELDALDRAIAVATVKRPTAEQVQAGWRELLEAWETATDAERSDLMQAVVERVEIKEKAKAAVRLFPITQRPSGKFVTNSKLGAQAQRISTFSPRN
jgi:hypothetical protein